MFQGTVIDAETIYLGMKIEEGFETLAKAVGDSDTTVQSMCEAVRERTSDLQGQMQTDSIEFRAEIRSLKVALCQAIKPIPVAKETQEA